MIKSTKPSSGIANPQEAAFDYIDLYASIDQFEGTIPGEQVTDAGLEYYLEFTLEDGSLMNYPPGGEASAIAIQIRGSALSATESPVYIVSPATEFIVQR